MLAYDPVSAAIASHDVAELRTVAKPEAAPSMNLANPSTQLFDEHPWDDGNPEGMPLPNGQIISAAQMFEEAGEPAPAPAPASAKQLALASSVAEARRRANAALQVAAVYVCL